MKKSKKTKSKIGIWARIKNIYDNSPGHAAFTYPIAYIIIAGFSGTVILGNAADFGGLTTNVAGVILFSIYLTPIWVLVGLIVSKKKLPYILSLVLGLLFFSFFIYIVWIMSRHYN